MNTDRPTGWPLPNSCSQRPEIDAVLLANVVSATGRPTSAPGISVSTDSQRAEAQAGDQVDPISILIVDDEPRNLTVLETVLSDPGYHLVRAESADEALLALISHEFALIILDVRLPNITGLELAQIIKERKRTAQIPIIFLTAYYQDDQHLLEGYGSGAVDYLNKPVNAAVLRSKVAVFAELYRKQRQVERSNKVLVAEVDSRQRAETELRELNSNLELLVAQRTHQIQSLLNEVDHRSKNILSLVMAIANQTVASSANEFVARFAERIRALATHHDMLVNAQWTNIDLAVLVQAQLAHFGDLVGTRITLDGPVLSIAAPAAQTLAMSIHELATNAIKHGSLSDRRGRVDVRWCTEEASFVLSWVERDGPSVSPPARRGFGSKVLKEMIELSLDGHAAIDYESAGLIWRFSCPASNILHVSLDSHGRSFQ